MSHANNGKKVFTLCLHIRKYLFVVIHRAKPVTEMQRQRNRGAWRDKLQFAGKKEKANLKMRFSGLICS